ncbi:MAG: hypothetical protein R2856_34950 [Caldilineaceae bacterium]
MLFSAYRYRRISGSRAALAVFASMASASLGPQEPCGVGGQAQWASVFFDFLGFLQPPAFLRVSPDPRRFPLHRGG